MSDEMRRLLDIQHDGHLYSKTVGDGMDDIVRGVKSCPHDDAADILAWTAGYWSSIAGRLYGMLTVARAEATASREVPRA